ncbi:MAG: hypothetical protein N3A61_01365, partial [Ignavibacteria bacterium]|nr:hypothetical protein [Ignavibacteria bacterium]
CFFKFFIEQKKKFTFRNKEHFSIDARLRPEGKSSQLVWVFDEFVNYINQRMRIWEFQAYTKSKLIIGSKKMYKQLIVALSKKLSEFRSTKLLEEIQHNLKIIKRESISPTEKSLNLKLTEGGIIDLQFLTQFLILQKSFSKFKLIHANLRNGILTKSAVKKDEIKILSENYSFLIDLVFFSQIAFNRKNPIIVSSEFEEYLIKKFFRIPISTNLVQHIDFKLKTNSNIIKKIYDSY